MIKQKILKDFCESDKIQYSFSGFKWTSDNIRKTNKFMILYLKEFR
jgi:hypothetical protein